LRRLNSRSCSLVILRSLLVASTLIVFFVLTIWTKSSVRGDSVPPRARNNYAPLQAKSVNNGGFSSPIFESVPGGVSGETVSPAVGDEIRVLRAVNATGGSGGSVNVLVQLDAQGDENAVGFSLTFDPILLSNPLVTRGADAAGGVVATNRMQEASGRFGVWCRSQS
jgi:hypothetical protein